MSDGTIAVIVVGSVIGYLAICGISYAFFVETHPPHYMDMWHAPAAALWPIALPVMLSSHFAGRAIKAFRSRPRIPRAQVRR